MAGVRAAGLPRRKMAGASTSAVKAMQAERRDAEARERYADLVGQHQRRASRIAFHCLRDGAEADEAVRDAFVKVYTHLASLPDELPFEIWLNRILINSCLDRIKGRTRQADSTHHLAGNVPSPEDQVPAYERRQTLGGAVARLPERQRLIFMLTHYQGYTSPQVSAVTGLNESTVCVYLSRAIRMLRTLLTERGYVGNDSARPL